MRLSWKVAGLLLLSLILWELIVRYCVVSPEQEVFDPNLGYIHAPYANILQTYEGYTRLSLDQFGLNNDALSDVPTTRVLVLGDSFVESYQVMREENFVHVLMHDWSDTLLFNAGVAGIAPDVALSLFKKLKDKVRPTHVLLCINAADFKELLEARASYDESGRVSSLWRVYDDFTAFKRIKLWIYDHSSLVTHLKWKYEGGIRVFIKKMMFQDQPNSVHSMDKMDVHEGIKRWLFVLNELKKEGKPVTVLIMPDIQYLPEGKAKGVRTTAREILTNEAENIGVPVLDANDVFVHDFQETLLPAKGFLNNTYGQGHLNIHGHQVLAHWLDSKRAVIVR